MSLFQCKADQGYKTRKWVEKFVMGQLDKSILKLRVCFHVALSEHFGIKPDLDLIKNSVENLNDKEMFDVIKQQNEAASKKTFVHRKQRLMPSLFSKHFPSFYKLRSLIGLHGHKNDRTGS